VKHTKRTSRVMGCRRWKSGSSQAFAGKGKKSEGERRFRGLPKDIRKNGVVLGLLTRILLKKREKRNDSRDNP